MVGLVELRQNRNKWRSDPLTYFEQRLNIPREKFDWSLLPAYQNHTWDGTPNPFVEISTSIANSQWVGIESAIGTGKTFFGGCITLAFLESYPNAVVVTTAPKENQLELHIWKEIGKLYPRFNLGKLSNLFLNMTPAKTGEPEWFATGFVAGQSAAEAEATQSKARGFHAEHLLIILEETTGIHWSVVSAFLDTCTAPHNVIIAFGNPDHQLDTLHRFCKLENVKHVRISALDHPNIVLKDPKFIVGATTEKSIAEKASRYGIDNPIYKSRVQGISPAQSHESLIKLEWCYKSLESEVIEGEKALGVDVANSIDGDKACKAYGEGNVLKSLQSFQCPNANQLGHQIALQMQEDKIELCAVDGVGVGAGTVNALKEHDIRVDSLSEGADDEGQLEQFNSLRSQMYWQMREDLRMGKVVLVKDEELFADLITPKWETRLGKICVESKKDIKKRLGRSPDKGDAVVYWNWARAKRGVGNEVVFSV